MRQLKRTAFSSLLALLMGALVAGPAFAQDDDLDIPDEDDDIPEEDEPGGDEPEEEDEELPTEEEAAEERARERRANALDDPDAPEEEPRAREGKTGKRRRVVREVVKGAYLKINVGPVFWLPPISRVTSTSATALDFNFGYDVLDRLAFTVAIEGGLNTLTANGQGLNDAQTYNALLASGIVPSIQGDFRVLAGTVNVRFGPNFGGKKTRRGSFMVQVGGGAGYSPPLVDLQDPVIIGRMTGAGLGKIMQGTFLGIITPGVGLEYYTKLSHFSIGVDIDANIILGGPVVAIGVGADFFAKYTF